MKTQLKTKLELKMNSIIELEELVMADINGGTVSLFAILDAMSLLADIY